MTKEELQFIMRNCLRSTVDKYIDSLNTTLIKYEINTPLRVACFIANVAEESGELRYTRELWDGKGHQALYERDFNHVWPPSKEDRRNETAYSLGNAKVGDGRRYLGRTFIQQTGYTNYSILAKDIGVDFITHPEKLEEPQYACEGAGHYWKRMRLNSVADLGKFDNVCDIINFGHPTQKEGDSVRYSERLKYFNFAKQIFHLN